MRRVGIIAVALGAALTACGGRQMLDRPADTDAGTATLGPVDLSQAPATLAMSCDHSVGSLAFINPCLVGFDLAGGPTTRPGLHTVECRLATPGAPLAWEFTLSLALLAQHPDQSIVLPDSSLISPSHGPIDLGGRQATLLRVMGTVTFSRIDPTNRAFIARFLGTALWIEPPGNTFSCAVDGPFWGAPGSFL